MRLRQIVGSCCSEGSAVWNTGHLFLNYVPVPCTGKSPHAHTGESPNWLLDRLEVVDVQAARTHTFTCNAWFGKDMVRRGSGLGSPVVWR